MKRTEPALRFEGFSETWQEKTLGEIAEIIAGGDVEKHKLVDTGNYPVLGNALTNDGIMGYYNDAYRIEAPAVTVTARGNGVGQAKARFVDFTPVGRLLVIKSSHNAYFLEQAINSYPIVVESSGIPQLTVPKLQKYKLLIPSLTEQEKIAEVLSAADELISLQSQKVAALKRHKQALMQQLFSTNGESVPRLRFDGFSEPWQLVLLKECAKVTTGNKDAQNKVEGGQYPFFVRSQTVEKIDSYTLDCEAILTSGDGAVGKHFHYIKGKFDFHQRVYCIYDFNTNISAKFMFYYFSEHFYERVMRLSAKNTVDSVRMNMITEMPIPLPSLAEQEKIAGVLSAADELISLHQQKLTTLKRHKQALMQRLFP
ncbi:restriction endonuclease subunit S [Entomospira nematocerorum]|uniref:Type I restriction modification DNA specificity domain-containing protein n=1 Tax=Entomospira nematocerorum TaxID=2719987 RepID=A0A968KUU1_9SPIO|nr:restriction endonuclease subunit S [Entomospira nematocera]NIZ46548.1 hypothetical protein [Entomospira nematocera]WDI33653.1 restriction endonuclease subunit S [Entomospira nematocera]